MELNKIIVSYPNITKLAGIETLPTKLKYKIFTTLNALEPTIKFFNEQRMALIKKYNVSIEDGKVVAPPDCLEKFLSESDELLSTDIDIDIRKGEIDINLELPLSAAELSTLTPFFDFTE